jgi:hypothetical protein
VHHARKLLIYPLIQLLSHVLLNLPPVDYVFHFGYLHCNIFTAWSVLLNCCHIQSCVPPKFSNTSSFPSSVPEMVKDSNAGKGRRVIESDESESDSIADPCTRDSYVHPTLIDPMSGPQPTATATGTGTGTRDATETYENPRVNIDGISRIEKDSQLKKALRGGPYGRVR